MRGPRVSHDPDELLAEYRRLQAEAQGCAISSRSFLA